VSVPVTDLATELPQVDAALLRVPDIQRLQVTKASAHAPRILLLYGSLRERSFSRLLSEEAARLLTAMGAEVRTFNPSGVPLPDDAPDTHPKVAELRELVLWSEGMVWCSPERHGAMTGIMKAQIDWIPLSVGAVRPTQASREVMLFHLPPKKAPCCGKPTFLCLQLYFSGMRTKLGSY
jgi:arsenic resistance protein ArsH